MTNDEKAICPKCLQYEFSVELPETDRQPRWIIHCTSCREQYELSPDGMILALGKERV